MTRTAEAMSTDTVETAPRLVRELFQTLPQPEDDFPAQSRAAWLIAAAALFDVLYGFDPENPVMVILSEQRVRH